MRRLLYISLVLSSTLSCNAIAAEKWKGFYVGAELGYMEGNDNGKEHMNGTFNGWKQNPEPSGASFGIVGGHNWLVTDKVIAGLEGRYNIYDADDNDNQKDTFFGGDCAPATDCGFKTEIEQSYSLLARLGYLINDKTLAYVIGGYTNAKIERTIYDGWFLNGSDKHSEWQNGWTLGLGSEFKFNNSLSVKFEYRYTDLGDTSFYSPAFGGVQEKFDYTQNEIAIGLNYHF